MSRYLLDTTILIGHLRGDDGVTRLLLNLLADGHDLGTSCVNVAEVIRGTRPKERRAVDGLLSRLNFLETTWEAATRAGRYQANFASRGITIHTADALVAGTARAHGSILITDNVDDFPMRDVRVQAPQVS
ncbi:MAG TPA: PIN domain-containing protein [Actinomycetota bacterium]|nr:PIN domain-containing protein [Actinomycetota bacterium]